MATYNAAGMMVRKSLFTPILLLEEDDFLEIYAAYVALNGGNEFLALAPHLFVEKHNIVIVPKY